jgi:L-threonylcarbamoyladenylate synthase
VSTAAVPEEPDVTDDPRDDEAGADGDDEGESLELEERDLEDDAYTRYDCTSGDTADAVDAARRAVEAGDCIVLPTDTVYGIGADAFSADAVQGLLDAKERGRDMPPPVLVGDASLVRALATDVPDQARELVDVHWPGPLTIVCRIQPSLRMDLGDTDGTIALRVPDHALAREILRRTGPLAVSSANLSGRPAALTCDEAVDQLGDRVAVYLDGGPLGTQEQDADVRHALPSTIVDFTRHDDGQLLRRGALSLETLRQVVPGLRDLDEPAGAPQPVEPVTREPDEPVSAQPVTTWTDEPVTDEPVRGRPDEPVTPESREPRPDEPQPDEPRVEPEPTP